MKTNEIRKKFLNFFKSKGHTIVESDSLVPKDDPTVLFTTAGMQQFKRQFLGHIDDYTRATTSQKCLRTDDLDEVGKTDFHHTFFEMLGNFSFGDYFKKEAISWAWEFFTQELKIDPKRLWVSVYKDDEEAYNIWLNDIKIPKEKIFKLGDKSNFWPSNAKQNGPNGPCGPCSEIFYDYDPNRGTTPKDPDDERGRFSEVWNLVFTQFNRKDGGVLEPLPSKNIDTGMGLERLAAVMQGRKCNYETDIFAPILKAIDKEIGIKDISETTLERNNRYVIADHIRSIVFGIADGVIPSNKERGSVIRKLIVEISDIAQRVTSSEKPVVYKLVSSVVEAMGEAYPYLKEKQKMIAENIESVEKAFIKVRNERIPEFDNIIIEYKNSPEKLGEALFTFKDRFGLTLRTMESLMSAKGISEHNAKKAINFYDELMKKQQEQSRASSKMQGDVFATETLNVDVPKTVFLGYEHAESNSRILQIFVDNEKVRTAEKGAQIKIVLDKTPFYAESGGQIGDSGVLFKEGGKIKITDTQKINDVFIHSGTVEEGQFTADETVQAIIDVDRRLSIMRNHTATHLLQSALRETLGEHIQQQGSLVDESRLRFDFTHHKAIAHNELSQIEDLINVFVRSCDAVKVEFLSIEEAKKTGALAFFAEKYGKTVRVVSIGNYSKEFCGGTHLGSTGQIGLFKIVQESAIAQGIRRIEAKTGIGALNYINEQQKQLEAIAKTLKAPINEAPKRIDSQAKRIKDLEKQMEEIQFESVKNSMDNILKNSESVNGAKLISEQFKNMDINILRKVSDMLRKKVQSSVIVLGASKEDNASILVSVSDDLVEKNIKANEIINEIAPIIDGSGGGKPQLAQAGSKSIDKIEKALKQANKLIKEKIQR